MIMILFNKYRKVYRNSGARNCKCTNQAYAVYLQKNQLAVSP